MKGRKISDHAFFAGGPSKECVAPKGVHVKSFKQDGDKDYVSQYRDTEESINKSQEATESKLSRNSAKSDERR